MSKKIQFLLLIILTLGISLFSYIQYSFAQSAQSNCVVTKVGNPQGPQPVLPAQCQSLGAPCQPGPTPPDYPVDLRQAIIDKFHITMNGFDDTHLRWAWEEFWFISGTNFSGLVKDAILLAQPGGTSHQDSCPNSGKQTVTISQFNPDNVFKFMITHELGHAIQLCNPRNVVKYNEHLNAWQTEGGVSRYGATSQNEDYADTMAYGVNPKETMSSNGGSNIAAHPFCPNPPIKPLHFNNVVLPVLFGK